VADRPLGPRYTCDRPEIVGRTEVLLKRWRLRDLRGKRTRPDQLLPVVLASDQTRLSCRNALVKRIPTVLPKINVCVRVSAGQQDARKLRNSWRIRPFDGA